MGMGHVVDRGKAHRVKRNEGLMEATWAEITRQRSGVAFLLSEDHHAQSRLKSRPG